MVWFLTLAMNNARFDVLVGVFLTTLLHDSAMMLDVAGNAGRFCRRRFITNITASDRCDADGDAGSLAPRQLYTDAATSSVFPPWPTASAVSCFT